MENTEIQRRPSGMGRLLFLGENNYLSEPFGVCLQKCLHVCEKPPNAAFINGEEKKTLRLGISVSFKYHVSTSNTALTQFSQLRTFKRIVIYSHCYCLLRHRWKLWKGFIETTIMLHERIVDIFYAASTITTPGASFGVTWIIKL